MFQQLMQMTHHSKQFVFVGTLQSMKEQTVHICTHAYAHKAVVHYGAGLRT
jgi:hypothetical protein